MKSLLLILLLQQVHWSISESVVEPSYGCGFNDSDLNLGKPTVRSPHNTGQWFKWIDGKIPYYFKGDVKDGDKALVRDIMDEIEAHTCFKYIQEDSEPSGHHIEIVIESPTCYRNGFGAYVQPQEPWPYKKVLLKSSKQLTDHKSCDNRGGLMHEMMHALGVGHTQKRADRDQYVIMLKDNIQKWSQYSVFKGGKLYNQVPYDCQSIMHYGMGTFSISRNKDKPTMQARNPETCKLSWQGPAFEVGKPAPSDWKLLEIISGQVCDMKAPRWLAWSEWSACSDPCGENGKQTRKRSCLVSGKCEGESQQEAKLQERKCSLQDFGQNYDANAAKNCPGWKSDCTVPKWKDYMQKWCARTCNCGEGTVSSWSSWSAWSQCSATCGDAAKTRSRTCPVAGKCPGESQETKNCDLPKCEAAKWSTWGSWTGCSATCGDGTKSRTRTCSIEGKCPGESQQTNKCDLPKCPSWSSWGAWSGCSATCGDATKTRSRTCSESGKCPGDSKQTNKCDLPKCVTSCKDHSARCPGWLQYCSWSQYKEYMEKTCPKTCKVCTEAAKWSTWGSWTGCSATCGDGTKSRTRTCSIEGKCPGESQQTNKCDLPKCLCEHTDKSSSCSQYAKYGDCTNSWADWMARNCAKTCKC